MRAMQFGTECPRCTWKHQVDAFKPQEKVLAPHPNRRGVVQEWGCYGGPVWVRVYFGGDVRANFRPCELEHA